MKPANATRPTRQARTSSRLARLIVNLTDGSLALLNAAWRILRIPIALAGFIALFVEPLQVLASRLGL